MSTAPATGAPSASNSSTSVSTSSISALERLRHAAHGEEGEEDDAMHKAMGLEDDDQELDLADLIAGLDKLSFTVPNEPFGADPRFLLEEGNSSITLANNGFLQAEFAKDKFASMFARADKWYRTVGATDEELAQISADFVQHIEEFQTSKSKFEPIYVRDAERTYITEYRRLLLCHFLTFVQKRALKGDYHQGVSMIAGFLLIFLPVPKVIAMLCAASTQPRFIPDVWRSVSIACVTDGYVLEHLLEKHWPSAFAAVKQHRAIPELYASKFWCALGLHVLSFRSLSRFFDDFWSPLGVLALFKLALLAITRQEKELAACASVDKVLELLRFDRDVVSYARSDELMAGLGSGLVAEPDAAADVTPDLARINQVVQSELGDPERLKELRKAMYDKHLAAKFADEKEPEKAPDCARPECKKPEGTGYYYCLECKMHLCDDCGYSAWNGHNDDDHNVRLNDDLEEGDKD